MCLGLEMLRGAPIAVKSDVRVRRAGDSPDKASATTAAASSAGKKGKGRARDEPDLGLVEVETPTDVRVYIDARCPATVEWFEDMFCREGRAGHGVTLDAGGAFFLLSLPRRRTAGAGADSAFFVRAQVRRSSSSRLCLPSPTSRRTSTRHPRPPRHRRRVRR